MKQLPLVARDPRTRSFLAACKSAVRKLAPDADVILFGSRARGDAAPDSDYDILVLCGEAETPALKRAVQEALYEVALEYDAVAPALVYSRARWDSPLARATPLHAAVAQEGVLL